MPGSDWYVAAERKIGRERLASVVGLDLIRLKLLAWARL